MKAKFLLVIVIMGFLVTFGSRHPPAYGAGAAMRVVDAATGKSVIFARVNDSVAINVKIENVVKMGGYEFMVMWNSSILNCTQGFFNSTIVQKVDIHNVNYTGPQGWQWWNTSEDPSTPPSAWGSSSFAAVDNVTILSDGTARYWLSLAALVPGGASGNFTVATLRFKVVGSGDSPLTLSGVTLGDVFGNNIAVTPYSGDFKTNIRDAAIIGVIPESSKIVQNSSVGVDVEVMNKGNIEESFSVSTYFNSTSGSVGVIGAQNVTDLAGGANKTLAFSWDTTRVNFGNYTVFANVTSPPDDVFTSDKKLLGGVIEVISPAYARHDMALTKFTENVTVLIAGEVAGLSVDIRNQGYQNEANCTLQVYLNGSLYNYTTIPEIFAGNTLPYLFNWNTSGKSGHYNFNASVSLNTGVADINISNNQHTLSLIVVQAPVASFTISPTGATVLQEVTFDASASHDPNGVIANYIWDFNDSTYLGYGAVVKHRFTSSGSYLVRLAIMDSDGLTYVAGRPMTYSCAAQQNLVIKPKSGSIISGDMLYYGAIGVIIVEILWLAYFVIRRKPKAG